MTYQFLFPLDIEIQAAKYSYFSFNSLLKNRTGSAFNFIFYGGKTFATFLLYFCWLVLLVLQKKMQSVPWVLCCIEKWILLTK